MSTDPINALLQDFAAISLEEMESVRLMNRIDTKYLTTQETLKELLQCMTNEYYVQEIKGKRISAYHTLYLDTVDSAMYMAHLCGRKIRKKVRIREYADSGLRFLEIKDKNNHGRTLKKRIRLNESQEVCSYEIRDFINASTSYEESDLIPQLENSFQRITLVNKLKTERLTIDLNLFFFNCQTQMQYAPSELVIIELKQDGNRDSFARYLLRELHIHPTGFSKYCMGCMLTNPELKYNRLKPKLMQINKLLKQF